MILGYGIDCGSGSCPEIYNEIGMKLFKPIKKLQNANYIGKNAISLNLHHKLKKKKLNIFVKV